MTSTPLITIPMLKAKGAICNELQIFADEWPQGATITLENIQRARELELDLDWLKTAFFDDNAWKVYDQIEQPALAAYNHIEAPVWEEYLRTQPPTREAYNLIEEPAWAAYDLAEATAFVTALIMSLTTREEQ